MQSGARVGIGGIRSNICLREVSAIFEGRRATLRSLPVAWTCLAQTYTRHGALDPT